jgi:hypothetical protein
MTVPFPLHSDAARGEMSGALFFDTSTRFSP